MIQSSLFKKTFYAVLVGCLLLQVLAIYHAYKFTHFSSPDVNKTKSPHKLSVAEKVKTLIFGIDNPRPKSSQLPNGQYIPLQIGPEKSMSCWFIKVNESIGTIVLFHGYSGEKSQLLDKSEVFNSLGYNTLLVDFLGSGGSAGNKTTLGYFEAEQVQLVVDYLMNSEERNIYLFGTSMGSVAIMRAISKYNLSLSGIILECPFGSMYSTVAARFQLMNAPVFPMAPLLTFWGGVINGFWAFDHNPIEYAKGISCPVLLMYGGKDETVSLAETNLIFNNLKGQKQLKIYPEAKHENYLIQYKEEWSRDVEDFLIK